MVATTMSSVAIIIRTRRGRHGTRKVLRGAARESCTDTVEPSAGHEVTEDDSGTSTPPTSPPRSPPPPPEQHPDANEQTNDTTPTPIFGTRATHDFAEMVRFSRKRDTVETEGPQARAFAFADQNGYLPVFSRELSGGARTYLVTGWRRFKQYYTSLRPEDRMYHEMFRYHRPCRYLYIDCDCRKSENTHISDYTVLTRAAMELVLRGLKERFGIDHTRVKARFYQSSNDEKHSVHLLFEIDRGRTIWYDCSHCGAFVRHVLKQLDDAHPLMVNDRRKNGVRTRVCCIDTAVYLANSGLRMYQSIKPGEIGRPKITGKESYEDLLRVVPEELDRSLVSYLRRDLSPSAYTVLMMPDASSTRIDDGATERRARRIVRTLPHRFEEIFRRRGHDERARSDVLMRRLVEVLFRPEDRAKFYSLKMTDDGSRLLISTYEQYCTFLGTEHDHNHSYYSVNLKGGYMSRICYSKSCNNNEQDMVVFGEEATRLALELVSMSDEGFSSGYLCANVDLCGSFGCLVGGIDGGRGGGDPKD